LSTIHQSKITIVIARIFHFNLSYFNSHATVVLESIAVSASLHYFIDIYLQFTLRNWYPML